MANQLSMFRGFLLVLCLVFTSSANAYMHIGEHDPSPEPSLSHLHEAEAQQHNHQDKDHDHHFHLHMVGDLVSHPALSADDNLQATAQEISQRLCSLAYAPPIPPPNV